MPTQAEVDAARAHYESLEAAKLADDIRKQQVELAKLGARLAALQQRTAVHAKSGDPPAVVDAPQAVIASSIASAGSQAPQPASKNTSGKENSKSDSADSFGGKFRLGAGLSITSDIGSRDRVGAASLDEAKFVRVSDQNNTRARIMLEGHYFIEPCHSFFGLRRNVCHDKKDFDYKGKGPDRLIASTWGWGPFVAVQPGGDDKLIDAIGMGLMVGFRKNPMTNQSFNIGIGYVVDPNTQVLGDGIRRDQPLPTGETEVRFKETTQTGILVLSSFSF